MKEAIDEPCSVSAKGRKKKEENVEGEKLYRGGKPRGSESSHRGEIGPREEQEWKNSNRLTGFY